MGNLELNAKVNQQQSLLIQRKCDKHEFITVTQTTTRNGPNPINTSNSWLQCKHCGLTHPMSTQTLQDADGR